MSDQASNELAESTSPNRATRRGLKARRRKKYARKFDNQVTPAPDCKLTERELNSLIPMKDVPKLSSLSIDTWHRLYPHLIVRLSERRCAVRLRDVLFLERPSPSCP
jgi:hypothetical protein